MGLLALLARVILGVVFAIAGVGKLADLEASRKSMIDFGVPAVLAGPLGILLPLAELVCAVALVPNRTASLGASGIAIMLVAFVAGMLVNLARGRKPECNCFGQLHSEPIGGKTIARNVVLLAVSLPVIAAGTNPSLPALPSFTRFEAWMVSALSVIGLALLLTLWLIIHVLRQNGRLLLRLETLEKTVGIHPSAPPLPGLPVGDPAPALRLSGLDGKVVTSETLYADARPVLFIFTELGCGACDALLPEVSEWQHEHAERLSIVTVGGGGLEANIAKSAEYKLKNFMLQVGREASEALKVSGTPSGVLVRDGKIDSPVAAGADQIRKLVTMATLPPAAKKGDPVPALHLNNLNGEPVDLSSFRGRRRLILFWSPTCGFCNAMLDDVKTWERDRPVDSPDLVIISSGTVEENRKQGFRSQVLLDPHFGAGSVLGANGTPSGVVIDEDGVVATDVRVGAADVLALAGVTLRKPTT